MRDLLIELKYAFQDWWAMRKMDEPPHEPPIMFTVYGPFHRETHLQGYVQIPVAQSAIDDAAIDIVGYLRKSGADKLSELYGYEIEPRHVNLRGPYEVVIWEGDRP
jgi:hypothetical protein